MEEFIQKLGVDANVAFYPFFLLLIWARTLMMGSVVPFLVGKPVPKYVLISVSLLLSVFTFFQIMPATPPPLTNDVFVMGALFVKEVFYGFTMGFAVSIVFQGFAAVGQFIDGQRGVSIARLLIPQLGEQGSISGAFLFQFGIVLFLALGGHLIFISNFVESFVVLPVMEFPEAGPSLTSLIDLFINITGQVIYIALQMSMPVIIAIFLADLILGIANRVAPQINVWELGFNVKGYLGVLLLFVSITMIAEQMQAYENSANGFVLQTVKTFKERPPAPAPLPAYPEDEGIRAPLEDAPKVETR